MAVMRVFLTGCTVLVLAVGCSGTRSEAPKEKEQEHTQATNTEQGRTAEATSEEVARCEGTRPSELSKNAPASVTPSTTNDLPGCPKGGLLLGTDKVDKLTGSKGDDEIRGLGANDELVGGVGRDVIYGGDGKDVLLGGASWWGGDELRRGPAYKDVLHGGAGKDYLSDHDGGDDVFYGGDGDEAIIGGEGEDVLYGGDGNDYLDGATVDLMGMSVRKQPDKLYCGEGEDHYLADKLDYVDSSCEVKDSPANL